MAFHHRLTRAQRILLAIFCFPLLPFYLCYAYCCATDDEDVKNNEMTERKPEPTAKARADVVDGRSNIGKEVRRNDIVYENEAAVIIQPKPKTSSLPKRKISSRREHQEEAVKDEESGNTNVVSVEIHPEKSTRWLPARFSFRKGKEVRRNDIVFENEGFVDHDNKRERLQKDEYAYPWDKSSLKSMHIDLGKLKNLDNYSSKVKPGDTVEALVQVLLKGRSGDLEKLRAVWMWVTHHIEYDVEGLRDPSQRSSSPADVLKTGKGVCAGYAGLFQAMCSVAGIECEEVSGYSKGGGYKLGAHFSGNGSHAWNAVRLEGRWHLLDSTWGAGNTSNNSSKFKFEYDEFYFLTHPALFAGDHFPLDAKWQLLTPPISLKQFENTVHLRSGFYNCGLLTTHPGTSLIQSDGKTTVTVQSSSPALFLPKLNGQHNCGGIMTLRPDGMNLDVYPESTGLHTLEIFAKAGDSAEDVTYTLVCEYQLRCRAVARETRPPEDLDNPVGPSWLTERKGLREPSQRDPVVFAADGRCSFGFRVAAGVHLMAKLSAAAFPMTNDEQNRHVFRSRRGDWVDHRVQVPKAGLYVFKVYTKDKEEAVTYDYACNYLVSCTNPKARWPVYPLRYATWKDQYELVEPLAGVLPANREVQFKMRIPDVSQVSVVGEDTHDLSLDADGYWTGFYSTGGCKDVNVMIQVSPGDRSRSFVLNYQVEIQ